MKALFRTVVTAFLVGACAKTAPPPKPMDGIRVGNGAPETKLSFRSEYAYAFEYSDKLTLERSPDGRDIILDNRGLVAKGEATSRLALRVVDLTAGSTSWEDFRAVVEKDFAAEYPALILKLGKLGRAQCLQAALSKNETRYYFRLPYNRYARVTLTLFETGQGESLLKPVFDTLTLEDSLPPEVHFLGWNELRVAPGDDVKLIVLALDFGVAASGIDDRQRRACVGLRLRSAAPGDDAFRVCEVLRPIAPHEYSIPFQLSYWLPSGEYVIDSFSLYDRAGNRTHLFGDDPTVRETSPLAVRKAF